MDRLCSQHVKLSSWGRCAYEDGLGSWPAFRSTLRRTDAPRIIEISRDGVNDFAGSYDEYLGRLGDDHLDRAAALVRAKREKRQEKAAALSGSR